MQFVKDASKAIVFFERAIENMEVVVQQIRDYPNNNLYNVAGYTPEELLATYSGELDNMKDALAGLRA